MFSFSLLVSFAPHTAASQVYSLAFNADVGTLGAILFVVSCFDTVVNPFVGYIQDNEWLSRYFSREFYGRRAPFYFTHVPIMIVGTAMFFFPLRDESGNANAVTYIWYTFFLVVCKWCHSVQSIAVGSATYEEFFSSDFFVIISSSLKLYAIQH